MAIGEIKQREIGSLYILLYWCKPTFFPLYCTPLYFLALHQSTNAPITANRKIDPMTNKQFDRSLNLATMPRFDGYDHQRWTWWSDFNVQRYGRRLDPYWGDAVRREPDYRSPEYPGHADQRKAA